MIRFTPDVTNYLVGCVNMLHNQPLSVARLRAKVENKEVTLRNLSAYLRCVVCLSPDEVTMVSTLVLSRSAEVNTVCDMKQNYD